MQTLITLYLTMHQKYKSIAGYIENQRNSNPKLTQDTRQTDRVLSAYFVCAFG